MAGEYIISGFGLQGIKTKVYRGMIGEERQAGVKRDISPLELEEIQHFNVEADDVARLSFLGTPVFSDLLIKESETGEGMYFDTVLFDVAMEKHIVKTMVQGRKGTVKEYISDGDYSISIRGGIINHGSSNYPSDDVAFFVNLMQIPAPLFVISPLLQLFDVQTIVIEKYQFMQRPGYQNIQLFEIDAVSDDPIESLILQ